MSDTTTKTMGKVLHVCPHPAQSGCVDEMDALLAAASLQADTCSDVYRGLARLCRVSEATHQAVIVCLDGLGAAELDFFSIVARVRPRTPVYVYGDEALKLRIAKTIELGAYGEATEEVIRTLATTVASPTSDSRNSDRLSQAKSPREAIRSAPPVETPDDEVAAEVTSDNGAESDYDDEDVSSGPVRVPWLRDKARPVRAGPRDRDPSRDETEASDPPEADRSAFGGSHEPLLTREELRALIGDDALTIAPEEHDATGAEGRDGDGGLS